MERDFSKIMSERTDKDLVNIVTIKQDEYEPEALIAAINELEKRKINAATFYTDDQIEHLKDLPNKEKETLLYKWQHKVLIVLLPFIILIAAIYVSEKFFGYKYGGGFGFCLIFVTQWLIHRNLKDNRYFKRAAEFKKWVAYTLYIYLAVLVVITIYVLLFYNYKP
jgi:hypothetical protein